MFKFILNRVYPDAPAPYSPREAVQRAIIEALVGHLYRLGYSVDEVRVPASLVAGKNVQFVSSYGQFRVAPGLDVFGDNVLTSALAGSDATIGNTASASVAAETVSTSSDDDLVKLIGETIVASASVEGGSHYLGAYRPPYLRIDGDLNVTKIATAVLSKLRAEGVIR